MGECLITEVAALREENTRLRQCLERLHNLASWRDVSAVDREHLLQIISDGLGNGSPCIQKT